MSADLPQSDLLFLIETLMPHRPDREAIARHLRKDKAGLAEMLETISENFIMAEKPLAFLSNRYLQFTRHTLFGV